MPDADVKRKLNRSLKNFFDLYMPLADAWDIFDNSSLEPVLVAKSNENGLQVLDKLLYQRWIKSGGKL